MSVPSSSRRRVLLALEGGALTREQQETVLRALVHLAHHLDILVLHPPRAPASLLAVLLLKLEHSGVDYRLAIAYGDLLDEVRRYHKRYSGRATILLEAPADLGDALEELRREGCLVLCLDGSGQ